VKHGLAVHEATGLLTGVCQVFSPHHDARPDGQQPELVIIHGISLPPGHYLIGRQVESAGAEERVVAD
jgi:AmpD protein